LEDNWLPPDNYQEQPVPVIAHRTSPTNIGLSLLANLSAYDFGYISAGQLIERTQNTFTHGKIGTQPDILQPRCSRSRMPIDFASQRESDVGGRRAMGDDRNRLLLIIIGRQPVVFQADERLKECPVLREMFRRKVVCSVVSVASRRNG